MNLSFSETSANAAVTLSLPNIFVISVAFMCFAARFSTACDNPTTEGRKFLSALLSKVRNILRRLVPALPASVILGAIASIAATNSLNCTPTEDAAPPAFSIALFKYGISAEPFCEAAARMLMYSAA